MRKKQFKAESKKLLDLMINSIYTNKEIFLRELISNASDALDKLYYKSLESGDTGIQRKDFVITLAPNKDDRTLTITDNGIGMTKEELEKDLGTIARSGSQEFRESMDKEKKEGEGEESEETKAENVQDLIGQFGVGFYSAFMVADEVTVTSKPYGSDEANVWKSSGADGYTIEETEKADHGTEIILHLKEDDDNEKYSRFLEEYTLQMLVRRYSDYISYPIQMMMTKQRKIEDEDNKEDGAEDSEKKEPKFESYQELETLNTMEPIWKRAKKDVSDDEYNSYYKDKFGDYEDPCRVIRTSVEGVSSYTALLFFPSHTPFNYYTKDYEKGLQLYSNGVLIMDKCKDLLPDYFNFVRGLVDSEDLSLNISRETLQQDRQVKSIARNLEKKIKRELVDFMKNDREGYEKFFKNFGSQIKYGIYESYGMKKDDLAELLLFYSSTEKKMISLDEYIAKMGEDQKNIYFAPGETIEKIDMLPQTEAAKAKGLEILYLTEDIDEFVLKMMRDYKEKEFKSITEEDLSQEQTEEEKKELEQLKEENKDLIDFVKETLKDDVTDVTVSKKLNKAPVSLISKGGISFEMAKTLNRVPGNNQDVQAEKVLEINPDHEAVARIREKLADEKDLAAVYVRLLYDQALLLSGLEISDPKEFGDDIITLITGDQKEEPKEEA